MPNRRKVLIGLGGSVALAGCLEDPEVTISVENIDGDPVENAEVEIIKEGGLFSDDEIVEEGSTDSSGDFVSHLSDGEHLVLVEHDDIGQVSEEIHVEDGGNKDITLTHDLVLVVEDSDGYAVSEADIEIVEEGAFTSDRVIRYGVTDESGEYTQNFIDESRLNIEISHPDYFTKDVSVDLDETHLHSVTLSSFVAEQKARQKTQEILENQTDYDEIRSISVSDSDEGTFVESKSNWMALRSSESAYAGKAADILEDIFASDADIHYFEIDLYGPTVDEYGEEGFSRALTVGMYEETANQINWGNYDSDNLSRHADTYNLNFALF